MPYKTIFKTSVCGLLFLFCFSCCKDKPDEICDPPWFVEIEEPLKAYLFAPGSYWVYKHENDGTEDSIVLSTLVDSLWIKLPATSNDTLKQIYFAEYYNTTHDYSFYNEISGKMIFRHEVLGLQWSQITYIYANSTYNNQGYGYLDISNSLVLNNNTFNDVRHFSIPGFSLPSSFKYNTDTYYSPNVGLVKWIEHDSINGDQTYSLLRYHIVPYQLIKRCHER